MARVRREGTEPDDFLPLPRDTFDVLVSLADRDRHGYAILQSLPFAGMKWRCVSRSEEVRIMC